MTGRRITFTDGHPDAEWLGALHDGELTPAEVREVATHTADCPDCRQLLAELVELASLSPELEPSLPDDSYWPALTARILDRVVEERGPASPEAAAPGIPAAGTRLPIPIRARAIPAPFWRWLVPLAAVCGVALLSWRLLLSGSSMMGEVGSPVPTHPTRSPMAKSNGASARDLAFRKEKKDESRETDADGRLDATAISAGQKPMTAAPPAAAPPAAAPPAAAPPTAAPPAAGPFDLLEKERATASATAAAPSSGSPGRSAAAPTGDMAAAPSKSAETRAAGLVNETPHLAELQGVPSEPYRDQLAAGVPLDSVLARSGREADSLWSFLALEQGAVRQETTHLRDRSRDKQAIGAAAPTAFAAPPDSVALVRAIAVLEVRLSLLKQLRPMDDRREIETRLEWLRKIWKEQGH